MFEGIPVFQGTPGPSHGWQWGLWTCTHWRTCWSVNLFHKFIPIFWGHLFVNFFCTRYFARINCEGAVSVAVLCQIPGCPHRQGSHLEGLCKRRTCLARLAMIRQAGHHLSCHIRKLLYQSFVLPNLDYCSVVWNSCGVVLSSKIERIQNYALRLIFYKPPRTSSVPLREILGWTSFKTRRHIALLCQVHWCLRKEAPSYLTSKFLTNSYLNYSTTRGGQKNLLKRTQHQFLPINFRVHGCTSIQQPSKEK